MQPKYFEARNTGSLNFTQLPLGAADLKRRMHVEVKK
jgi:hypothetical protein